MSISRQLHAIAFAIIAVGVFLIFLISLGDKLFSLATTQLDMSGDGFKNYYTFSYQYLYGEGLRFNGLLYPYGDVAIFADTQLLLVWILQGFRSIGLDAKDHLLLIINILPIISYAFGGYFLYKIFLHYKLNWSIAVLFGIVGIMLSPQVFRIQSHYALAYAFIIPLYWYGIIQFFKKPGIIFFLFLSLFSFAVGFIHPYMVFILSLFTVSIAFVESVRNKKIQLTLFALGILPVLSFYLFIGYMDPVIDRASNPYGILSFNTKLYDFFPTDGMFAIKSGFKEGYCYLSGLIFLLPLLLFVNWLLKKIRNTDGISLVKDPQLSGFFIASLLILALAMGAHVYLTNGLILDILSPMKQFRSLGRLSWIFYYVGFVYLSVLFYHFINKIKHRYLKFFICFLLISFWSYDLYVYHQAVGENISKYKSGDLLKSRTQIQDLLTEKAYDRNRFQAVLTLPISTEGAEKIHIKDSWFPRTLALPFCVQSGIPTTHCSMSRVSLGNILKISQITSSPYIQKEVLDDLKSDEPFLVVIQNDQLGDFSDFLESCTFLNKSENISLFELPVDVLRHQEFISHDDLKQMIDISLLSEGEIHHMDSTQILMYRNFDTDGSDMGMLGSKAFYSEKGYSTIIDKRLSLQNDETVEISCWYKIQKDKSNIPDFRVFCYAERDELIFQKSFKDRDVKRVEVFEDWVRIKREYTLAKHTERFVFKANGDNLILDQVLLKSPQLDVFMESKQSGIYYLNHTLASLSE